MNLMPRLAFGWHTAWWYTAAFGLTNLTLISIAPEGFARRLFRLPSWVSWRERALSMVTLFLFARGLMVYSVFVPLRLGTVWVWLGSVIFLGGLAFHSVTMTHFAHTPPDEPVTSGGYRLTRHPMQLCSILMWAGVALATFSWVITLACLAQALLLGPFLRAQERDCLEIYGDAYRRYMERTPRYLGSAEPVQNPT